MMYLIFSKKKKHLFLYSFVFNTRYSFLNEILTKFSFLTSYQLEIVSGLRWESVSTSPFCFRAPSVVNPCMPYVCMLCQSLWVLMSFDHVDLCYKFLDVLHSLWFLRIEWLTESKFHTSLEVPCFLKFCQFLFGFIIFYLFIFYLFFHIHYGFWVCFFWNF